jgi:hypothetical protein
MRHCFVYVRREGQRTFCMGEAKHYPRVPYANEYYSPPRDAMCCECYTAFTASRPCKHAPSPVVSARGNLVAKET